MNQMEQRGSAARRVVRPERNLDDPGESVRLLHRSAAAGAQVGQEERGEEQPEGMCRPMISLHDTTRQIVCCFFLCWQDNHVQRLGLSEAARDGHQVRLSGTRAGLRRVHRSGHRQRAREEHQGYVFNTLFFLRFFKWNQRFYNFTSLSLLTSILNILFHKKYKTWSTSNASKSTRIF